MMTYVKFFSSSLEVYRPGYFCILHIDHDKKLIVYAISFNKKRAGNVILASFFFLHADTH